MEGKKISISLSEVYSSGVDDKIKTQAAVARTAEHSQQRQATSPPPLSATGAATTSGASTVPARSIPWFPVCWGAGGEFLGWLFGNPMFSEAEARGEPTGGAVLLFFACMAGFISAAIATAEPVSSKNPAKAVKSALIAVLIGLPGCFIGIIVIGLIQRALLGDWTPRGDGLSIVLILWRSCAWVLIGAVVALTPGLLLRSARRLGIGVLGGAIGGAIGGVLFDVLNVATGTAGLSRLVGVMAVSIGAVVATHLLENVMKTGWLFVRAGLIVGKQFILYRNPTTIGSSPQCEIYLFKDTQIAPRHAALHILPGRFEIEALDRAFPLYLNGQAVSRQLLKGGDQVQIGSTVLEFQVKAQQPSAQ